MKKVSLYMAAVTVLLLICLMPAASAETLEDCINNLILPKQRYNIDMNQSYENNNFTDGSINPQTGEFVLRQTDYTLPGINGLDVDITRIYRSGQVSNYQMYTKLENGVLVGCEDDNWFAPQAMAFYDSRYFLGAGWRFSFPTIEIMQSSDGTAYLYLHTDSGAVYRLLDPVTVDGVETFELEGYKLDDMVVQGYDGSFPEAEEVPRYMLIEKDGTRTYFSGDSNNNYEGVILGIKDRYGNYIKFYHDEISYFVEHDASQEAYYNIDYAPITKIVDSAGREILFDYHADDDDFWTDGTDLQHNFDVTITLPDGQMILYTKSNMRFTGEMGRSTRQRLEGVYTLTDATQYGVNGYYGEAKYLYGYEYAKNAFSARDEEMENKRGNYWENLNFIAWGDTNRGKAIEYENVTEKFGTSGRQLNRRGKAIKDLLLQDYTITTPPISGLGLQDYWSGSSYTGTTIDENYYYYDDEHPSLANPLKEGFESESSEDLLIQNSKDGEWRRAKEAARDGQYGLYNYLSGGHTAKATLDLGVTGDFTIGIDAKIAAGSEGEGSFQIGMVKEDGTTTYEEIPLVAGEDWKTFTVRGYDIRKIILLYEPSGYVIYLDNLFVGKGYTTDVQKFATRTYTGESYIYTYDNLLKSVSLTNDMDVFHTKTYEYDEHDMPDKITTSISQYKSASSLSSHKDTVQTYTYDDYGNLLSYSGPEYNGAHVEYTYAPPEKYHTVTSKTEKDEDGTVLSCTNYTVDSLGNITQEEQQYAGTGTSAQYQYTLYTYDTYGNLLSRQRNNPRDSTATTEHYEYGAIDDTHTDGGLYLTKKYSGDNISPIWYTYDFETGLLLSEKRNNGVADIVKSYEYDSKYRVTKMSENKGDTEYTYNDKGRYIYGDYISNQVVEVETPQDHVMYELNIYGDIVQEVDYDTNLYRNYYEYDIRFNGNRLIARQIDANEKSTYYTYDILDRLTQKKYSDNSTVNISYLGQPDRNEQYGAEYSVTITDENGNDTTYYLDKADRILATETSPDGITYYAVKNEYDALGRKTKTTDARGNATTYEYDMRSRLVKTTDALGNNTLYTYNGNDKVFEKTEPQQGNAYTAYDYDSAGRLIHEGQGFDDAVHYDRQYRTITYNNCDAITSQELTRVEENEYYTDSDIVYTYDSDNRIARKIETDGTLQRITDYDYDFNGNITLEKTYANEAQTDYIQTYYNYDKLNRKTWQISSAQYNGQTVGTQRIAYFYDNMDHLTEVREYKGADDDAGYLSTQYEYDQRYNLTKKTEPSGVVTQYTYDAKGNPITQTLTAGGQSYSTTNQYDKLGRLVSTTNALGQMTQYAYDENGNKTITMDARFADAPINVSASYILMEYDARNRPVKKILHDGSWDETISEVREYDSRGNVTKLMNGEGYADGQKGTAMTYDFANNMVTSATPEAAAAGKVSKRYRYDAAKRLIGETVYQNAADPGATTSYRYDFNQLSSTVDPQGNEEEHTYDLTGKLFEQITDKNGNVTKIFKSLYGTPYKTEYPDGTTETIDFDWYLGLAIAVTDRKNRKRKYQYNNAKQITEESYIYDTDESGTEYERVIAYTYDAFGNLTKQELKKRIGTSSEDLGRTTEYTYDALFRVTAVEKSDGSEVLYQYDAAGNTTQKKYRIAQDVYEVWGYSYDAFNRLSGESVMVDSSFMDGQGTTGQEAQQTTYTYNAAGQVQSKTDPNNHTTTYMYDASGNLIQETSPSGAATQYSYDYTGNLTQKTNAIGGYEKYGYDSLLRLVSKKTNPANDTDGELTWTYGYDAKGNLISEQTPAMVRAGADKKLTYTYDNMNRLTASYNAEGQLLKAYKYDNAGNIIKEVDGLHAASASEIDTAAGTSYVYDAFDNVTSQTDAAGNTTGYAYNLRGDLTSQTDARGNTTSYTYNDEGRLASVQYPDGGRTSYTYDDKGRVLTQTTKQSSSVSATETYTYTPFDTVYTITDAAGNVTTTLCDGLGNPVSVTDARGNTTQYSYNADGRLSQITTPLTDTVNMVESYTYDGAGNVLTVTKAGDEAAPSRVTTYTYLAGGQVASVSNNAGQSTLYVYDGAGNLSQQKVLRDSGAGVYDITSWTYDLYDRPVTVSQQLTLNDSGQTAVATTSYTYNILGMKTSESTPLSSNAEYTGQYTTSYAYDTVGRLSSVSRFHDNQGAPQAVTTQYAYDAVGNQTSVTDEAGYTTAYAYDSMNRVTSVTNALNETTSYEYDLAGNCVKETRPNGIWTYEYDAMNRLSVTKNPNGTVVQKLLYDENGNVIKTIDARGYASASTDSARYGTVYTYNQANMVAQITTAEGNTTTYAYTAQGDVKSVTDGENNTTSYTYDGAGRVVSATNAEGETTSYTYDLAGNQMKMTDGLGHETHYGYGAFGMLLSVTDALGREIAYSYDVEGNLTQMTDRGGKVTTYGYDNRGNLASKSADGQNITYSYDTMGNRVSMTDSTGAYTYTYDALGRMTAQAKDGSTQVSYGYDAAGNMTSMSYNGITVAYTYDNQNRMTAASGGGASASYSYDDNGNVTAVSYGSGAVHEMRQYNKDNAVTRIENSTSDGTAVYQYTYDGAGRVATKTDPYGTTSYVYDAAGRLLKVTMPGAETEYTYDAAGNRASMTQTSTSAKTYHDVQANEDLAYNKAVTTYTYTETNELAKTDRVLYNESTARITENTTYSYDPSGNLYSSVVAVMRAADGDAELALGTEDNSLVTMTVNAYDAWNQLVKTSVTKQGQTSEVSYTYNGDGIRTSRTVAAEDGTKTVQYLTSGGTVLAQTGDDTAAYVRGMGYIAKIGASNDVHYYQYNAHGDVVQVASGASGEVENRYDYDAFGEEILAVEETPNDIRYSGEFYDAAAGLYYLRARYYDPATGRFTQEDTYRGDVMEPASLNLYAYCANDPVNYVDPSGHGPTIVTNVTTTTSDDGRFITVRTEYASGGAFTTTLSASKYNGGGFVHNGSGKGMTAANVGDVVSGGIVIGTVESGADILSSVSNFTILGYSEQNEVYNAYTAVQNGEISAEEYMQIVDQNGGSFSYISPEMENYSGNASVRELIVTLASGDTVAAEKMLAEMDEAAREEFLQLYVKGVGGINQNMPDNMYQGLYGAWDRPPVVEVAPGKWIPAPSGGENGDINRYGNYQFTIFDALNWLIQTGGNITFYLQVRDLQNLNYYNEEKGIYEFDSWEAKEQSAQWQAGVINTFITATEYLIHAGYGEVQMPKFYIGAIETMPKTLLNDVDGRPGIYDRVIELVGDDSMIAGAYYGEDIGVDVRSEEIDGKTVNVYYVKPEDLEMMRKVSDFIHGERGAKLMYIPYYTGGSADEFCTRVETVAMQNYTANDGSLRPMFDLIFLQPGSFFQNNRKEGTVDTIAKRIIKWNNDQGPKGIYSTLGLQMEYDMSLVTGRVGALDGVYNIPAHEKQKVLVDYLNAAAKLREAGAPISAYSGGINEQGYASPFGNSNRLNTGNYMIWGAPSIEHKNGDSIEYYEYTEESFGYGNNRPFSNFSGYGGNLIYDINNHLYRGDSMPAF